MTMAGQVGGRAHPVPDRAPLPNRSRHPDAAAARLTLARDVARLWNTTQLTQDQICGRLGITTAVIRRIRRDYGIPDRPRPPARRPSNPVTGPETVQVNTEPPGVPTVPTLTHMDAAVARAADQERVDVEHLETVLADPWTWRVIARHADDVRERLLQHDDTDRLSALMLRLTGIATEVEHALRAVAVDGAT